MTVQSPALPTVFLNPSKLFIGRCPAEVKTILGSCISVTMFHRRLKIGAICHALQPYCREKERCTADCDEKFKYTNCVVSQMVEKICRPEPRPEEIEVKLFGGADMFSTEPGRKKTRSVGRQNIESAIYAIESLGLRLKAANVGGCFGRKIIFYPHTGEVLLKFLKKSSLNGHERNLRRCG